MAFLPGGTACSSWEMFCVFQQGGFGLQQFPFRSDLSHYFISSSRLVELLKNAAKSEKEDKKLPSVVSDLLQVALKEGAFELFWNEVVENGLLKEKSGPVRFVSTYTVISHVILLFLDPEVLTSISLHAPPPFPSTSSVFPCVWIYCCALA